MARPSGSRGGGKSSSKSGGISLKKAKAGAAATRAAAKGGVRSTTLSNPFEVRGNKRQRFQVLNRRTKGADRNVALARSNAQETRHKTLLQEFVQSTKSNEIVDRRFGEGEAGVSAEEKYLARFQKARKKKSLYNLDDNAKNNPLVGQTLGGLLDGDDVDRDERPFGDSDDDNEGEVDGPDKMDANAFMQQLHDRGITQLRKKYGDELTEEELQSKRSKKEVMEEVIKKSKLFKLERQRQQEVDQDTIDRLDDEIEGILRGGLLVKRQTKKEVREEEKNAILERLVARQGARAAGKDPDKIFAAAAASNTSEPDEKTADKNKLDDEYDRNMRELVFERRVAGTDRTRTEEEIAKAARAKLEKQQEELLKRMRGEEDSGDESEGEEDDGKGHRARAAAAEKAKAKNNQAARSKDGKRKGDALEDEEDERTGIVKKKSKPMKQDSMGNDVEDESESDSSDSDDTDTTEDTDDDDAEMGSEDDEYDNMIAEALAFKQKEMEDAAEAANDNNKSIKTKKPERDDRARLEAMKLARGELPFLLDAPSSHLELLELLAKYPDASLDTIVQRVAQTNSVHLAAENRPIMSRFITSLLDHLAFSVDRAASGDLGGIGGADDADVVVARLYAIGKSAPMETAREFMNKLEGMQRTLRIQLSRSAVATQAAGGDYGSLNAKNGVASAVLKKGKAGGHKGQKGKRVLEEEAADMDHKAQVYSDAAPGMKTSACRCWPSPGEIALIRTATRLFPATDFRHPIISPAQLLVAQYLSQCPLRGPRDVVAALATCQLMVDLTVGAKRISPELVVTLEALLSQITAMSSSTASASVAALTSSAVCSRGAIALDCFAWLRRGVQTVNDDADMEEEEQGAKGVPLNFLRYGTDAGKPTVALCRLVVGVTTKLIDGLLATHIDSRALDSLTSGWLAALDTQRLLSMSKDELWCAAPLMTLRNSVVSKCNAMLETRQPMQMQTFKPEPVKAIAPLFTEDYKWSKDSTDPDKERTEMKKLKRKVQRERKGAARELRKDGAYLAQVRDTNRQEKLDDMRSQRKRNMASLDDESALYNAAVRFGAEIKGGGTASIDRKGKRKM